jgi:WD40 repeat protein
MTRQIIKIITLISFFAAALIIAVLVFAPEMLFRSQDNEVQATRVIIPRTVSGDEISVTEDNPEKMAYEDSMMSKAAMNEGEYLLAVITQNFDDDPLEEQILAYRIPTEADGPVYTAFIDFDDKTLSYRRVWDIASPVTKAGTLNIYTDDLIGDRSLCLVIMGMNSAGEQTLTIFRKNPQQIPNSSTIVPNNSDFQDIPEEIFHKIAELSIDGSIVIQETQRSTAYQIMFSPGDSYSIATYGRDYDSSNIMDQIETKYSYNTVNGLYEQSNIAKIPGNQIEQRRVRELLSGTSETFESFINGLWYVVSPQGSLNDNQFIYFDPEKREIIFHGEDTYQVFVWQTSTSTRYGLQIGSQNSSVSTLRRTIAIELASLESIRISVYEDVRLKIGVTTPWNGTYRKANIADLPAETQDAPITPHITAVYDGLIGRIAFSENGDYQLTQGGNLQEGKYAFFKIDDTELLELRPQNVPDLGRDLYRVERSPETESIASAGELTLRRVMIGTKGIQDLHEAAITVTASNE